VGISAYYFMPRYPERGGKIALNILIYNTLVGLIPVVVLLIYPGALNFMFRDLQSYAPLLALMAMIFLTSALVEIIPTAMQDVRNSTLFVVGTQLLKAILIILAGILIGTVRSLIWATIISAGISVVILLRYLYRKFGPFWTHFDSHFFYEQLAYALPFGVYGMIYILRSYLDNYFISAQFTPAEYAIYAIGWLETPLISLFLESMLAVMVVRVSALQHEGRVDDIRHLMASAINRLATVQFPIYALLLVAGKDLIVFFYTDRYQASARIFAITITLIALNVFIYDPVVRSYKHLRKYVLIVRVCVIATEFAVLVPIVRHYGMIGAALTAVGADVVERLIVGAKVCKTVEATRRDLRLFKDLLRITALTTVAALAAFGVRTLTANQWIVLRLMAMGTVFGVIYLTGFYLFKLPGWETISKDNLLQMYRRKFGALKGASA
jgi:O-antigen/teichoic acid export membrane protein